MKKIILLIITLVWIGSYTFSQRDVEFNKKEFSNDKDGLKEAVKSIKEGDKAYYKEPFPDYRSALNSYLSAQQFNPNNSELNYKLGMCYIKTSFRQKAKEYFEKAYKLNPNVAPEIKYYVGWSNQLSANWDEAIKFYKDFARENANNRGIDADLVKDAVKKQQECKSGKNLVKKPIRVFIDNLGGNINTEYPEYGMIMNANGSEIYFTSRRNTTTGGKVDEGDGMYFEDILHATRTKNDWSKAAPLGDPINTKGHDATVALSPDGQKMLVYIDDNGDGNIYESKRVGDSWSKPKKLDKIISSKYHESSAWYSPDGKKLFFVSNRPKDGSLKGMPQDRDIYYVTWDEEKQRWDNLVRLPDNINTPYDEDGIFMHPDGKTLYFSSKGHNSMGGYDIFYTVMDAKGKFSNPVNIGYPVNTPDDDIFFNLTASGRYGYMTSFRGDGFGEKDLYKITFLGDAKEPLLNTEEILLAQSNFVKQEKTVEPIIVNERGELALLKGTIYDDETKKPLYAKIELYDNETGTLLAEFESDEQTGRYMLSLPAGKNYGIAVRSDGYLFHSENFDIPKGSNYTEYEKDVYMKKIRVGESIVLKNIFYDFDKYDLRKESESELTRLVKLMEQYPTMRIELSSHTDSRGADAYNKTLSQNRAKSVVDYLIAHGINKSRLEFKGYGEEKLIHSDAAINQLKTKKEQEAAHQENRRTEFKILSM